MYLTADPGSLHCGPLGSRRRHPGRQTEERRFFSIQTGNVSFFFSLMWVKCCRIKSEVTCVWIQRSGSAVSITTGADTAAHRPVRLREAWSEHSPAPVSSCDTSTGHKPAASPPKNPIRTKSLSPVAPPLAPPPQAPHPHYIQGSLRHPDFQHNGERPA